MANPAVDLSEILTALFEKSVVLFAGAGVGKKANLPEWTDYLAYLADVVSDYERETADLMRKRIQEDLLPEAAHLYKTCPLIPEGERWSKLAAPFQKNRYDVTGLLDLVSLPFNAVVTTNYDHSLHHAIAAARNVFPRPLELDDTTLRQGPNIDEFYVSRIHGRVEVPTSIVLDTADYEALGKNQTYIDFVVNLLTKRSCLFLGFSFHDPAIRKLLDIFSERVGPTFPTLHTAVLPNNARVLSDRLQRYNMRVMTYPEGRHDVVWEAVRLTRQSLRTKPVAIIADARHSLFDIMKRFLSSCYVRFKLERQIEPLRRVVLEGLILGLITEGNGGKTRETLMVELRELLRMSAAEVEPILAGGVDSLLQRGICDEKEGFVVMVQSMRNWLDEGMDILISGVVHRLVVREDVPSPEGHGPLVRAILEEILLERGWDLGAHFAAAQTSDRFDIMAIIRQASARHSKAESGVRQEQIAKAIYHLVASPDDTEARILLEIGRLSFGIDMAVERPRGSLLWAAALPNRIYLDASVLLPIIVPGHPATDSYVGTLKKLVDSATWSGVDVRVVVNTPFLDEVISHRRISRQIVSEHGLEDPRRLDQYVGLRIGGENVFVVAYSTRLRSGSERVSYREFLNEVAPYETESRLRQFLMGQGIQVAKPAPPDEDEHARDNALRIALHAAYGEDEEWRLSPKPGVLIDHEASQLWQLDYDSRVGLRSIFVTADVRIRRLVSRGRLSGLGALLLSPLGAIQLVDLLVGVKPEGRSYARIMWAVKALPDIEAVQEHFIDKGLQHYFGEAYAQGVPELIKIVADLTKEAQEAKEREGIDFRPMTAREIRRTLTVLGDFENRFYEKMAKEIRRRDV